MTGDIGYLEPHLADIEGSVATEVVDECVQYVTPR